MTSQPEIRVSAVVVLDEAGRTLLVRKRGTAKFMQPGGKPEVGETPAETAARELGEELGITVTPDELTPLGNHRAAAANEPGHVVVADAFSLVVDPSTVAAHAEIAEARWVTRGDEVEYAPLAEFVLLPLVWGTEG